MDEVRRPETLTRAVVSALGEAIIRGELAQGEALREVPLARQVSASRGTVREALRELEALGLVEIAPHRGASVRAVTARWAEEITSLRAVLESFAADLALKRAPSLPGLISDVEAAMEDHREAAASGELMRIVETDMAFHERLSSYSGHDLLLGQLRALQAQTRLFIVSMKQYQAGTGGTVDRHLTILEALRSGDAGKLRSAVYEHIISSGERLISRMGEDGTGELLAAVRMDRGQHGSDGLLDRPPRRCKT